MPQIYYWLLRFCVALAVLISSSANAEENTLMVYSEVPGAEPSDHYRLSVRKAGGQTVSWQSAFPFITRARDGDKYFESLKDWSNTYINFEMAGPVEVELTRADGMPIETALARPGRKVQECVVRDGRAYLTILEPCLIAVDIDGQMEGQNTGKGYDGPPIHTVTIFANPVLKDRPEPDDPDVLAVSPGNIPPHDGPWRTLYFLPGVHDLGVAFPLHANRNYYIPGNAIVHGTMSNHGQWEDGHHIRIFGYGTLSGERIPHPELSSPAPEKPGHHTPIQIVGATNTSVEGITIADSAYHSLMLIAPHKPEEPTDMRWVKIFTWRANGDGINPFGNGLVEDCFIRTQDDSIYVNGRGIRRVTFWNDANGSTFVLSALPDRPLVAEDCDVLYARANWHHWSGGRLFNMRGEGKGQSGRDVIFRDIRVHDPRPTLQHFMIAMEGIPPYSNPAKRQRGSGNLSGVLFKDIEIAAPSVLGEPDILWGSPEAQITDLIFDNVMIGGKKIESPDHFQHNDHVRDIRFR